MNSIFNMDNKFFTIMAKVADFMLLNLLCILCCIPIVTAGPAITAMYYVTMKMVRNEESYIVKEFFHSFRQNLRQGIIINIILMIAGIAVIFDFYFMWTMRSVDTIYKVLMYVFLVGILIYLMICAYIYPLLAKFFNTIKNTFKNAFLISIRHIHYTLLMILITAFPVVIMLFSMKGLAIGVLFYMMAGFAIISYMNSVFLVKIFDRYIPQAEEAVEEETDKTIDSSVFTNLQVTEIAEDDETVTAEPVAIEAEEQE